jgi:DNA polymerase elongation subunit (family B)
MLDNVIIENAIFIDIETAPLVSGFSILPEVFQELWIDKHGKRLAENETIEHQFFNTAGIYAEFGKVICISMGFLKRDGDTKTLRIRSFASHNESELLSEFADLLNKHYSSSDKYFFCGHNINEFDIPYLCRRMLVNNIKLPSILDLSGKKPWEIKHVDTMLHWKFGDYKSFISLKLLAALFNIPTPKDDISGKDVGAVYWKENNLERIQVYCQKDVLTVAQLLLKFKYLPLLEKEQVVFVN